MKRRSLLGYATVVVLLVAAVAAFLTYGSFEKRSAATAPGAVVVEIGTFSTGIDYAPYYVAKKMGWLDEAARANGATLTYLDFEALPAINDALASDRLDIVLEADTPAIIQEAAGNDITVVAPLAALKRELILPNNSDIRSLADLRGKRIGVLSGTGFHYGLVDALDAAGLPRGSYTVVNLAPPEARGALAAGTIDAWAVWPPFPQQELVARTGKTIPLGVGRVHSLVFASEEFRAAHPALVNALALAIERGRQFIASSPEQAKVLVSEETGLERAVVDLAWGTMDFRSSMDPAVVQEIQAQADFLADGGYVTRKVDVGGALFVAR